MRDVKRGGRQCFTRLMTASEDRMQGSLARDKAGEKQKPDKAGSSVWY